MSTEGRHRPFTEIEAMRTAPTGILGCIEKTNTGSDDSPQAQLIFTVFLSASANRFWQQLGRVLRTRFSATGFDWLQPQFLVPVFSPQQQTARPVDLQHIPPPTVSTVTGHPMLPTANRTRLTSATPRRLPFRNCRCNRIMRTS
jgi:hypothetical protein